MQRPGSIISARARLCLVARLFTLMEWSCTLCSADPIVSPALSGEEDYDAYLLWLAEALQQGAKAPRHVNKHAKRAMMTGVDRHRKQVAASQRYYEKKRNEGKSHNQAIRALGRHLCRVIFQMLKHNRDYEIRD